ncbi:MAG: hypothetical protein R6X29_02570 [Acidimicrobiia bacterium]
MTSHLRPIERRVLAMTTLGLEPAQIGAKIRRSPAHVVRIITWTQIPRSGPPPLRATSARQRRVLLLRSRGETHEQIATRFRRSPRAIRQSEGLAHFRLALGLLERDAGTAS